MISKTAHGSGCGRFEQIGMGWAKMGKQHYMTRDERLQLEALSRAKIPVSQIARQLGFSRQTIYNELQRGRYIHTCSYYDETRYSADKAQQLHNYN